MQAKDPGRAIPLLLQAAHEGDLRGLVLLGRFNLAGDGVPRDPAKGVGYLKEAVAKGSRGGKFYLGLCFIGGSGVPSDPAKGRSLIREAAELGHPSAQEWLGQDLLEGEPGESQFREARAWLEKATAQGEAQATASLSSLLQAGKGGAKDLVRAEVLARKALEGGTSWAQNVLFSILDETHRRHELAPPVDPFTRISACRSALDEGLWAILGALDEKWGTTWKALASHPTTRPPFDLLIIPMTRTSGPAAGGQEPGAGGIRWEVPTGTRFPLIPVASVKQEYQFLAEHGVPSGLRQRAGSQALLMGPPRDQLQFVDATGQQWVAQFAIGSFFGDLAKENAPLLTAEAEALLQDLCRRKFQEACEPARRKRLASASPSLALVPSVDLLEFLRANKPNPPRIAAAARQLRQQLPFNPAAQFLAGLAFLVAGDTPEAILQKGWCERLVD